MTSFVRFGLRLLQAIQSQRAFNALHVEIVPVENLQVPSHWITAGLSRWRCEGARF